MTEPVIRGVSYCLIHAPNLLVHYGTTPAMERRMHPDSAYLARLPQHLRSYADALAYPPNQTYLGRLRPDELARIPRPWYEHPVEGAEREARYGEMMPEDEFLALLRLVDTFDLVHLEAGFAAAMAERLAAHPLWAADAARLGPGKDLTELRRLLEEHAAPLYLGDRLVGVVRRAHEQDETLSSHVMLENLVTKASAVLGLKHLFAKTGVNPEDVEYIIECSEEACGDMNQRGGGNFAKAIGEMAGCVNATGSDTRSFCAGPTHALIEAAALIRAGVYRHVVVLAGGTPAKLGLNSRDHVAKGLPALEDVIGAFAIHLSADDYVSPRVRLDVVGRHKIGSGSSPQAVMEALVTEPLDRAGLKLTDVDRYGVEMQNPELTEPAGAGDVPQSNYKLIAALAVKRGEIGRAELPAFVAAHGMPGFAPTQGHIPSGVPVIGPVREAIMAGEIQRAMIIGKGSLFLGRMTNLFDGVSVLLERNPGKPAEEPVGAPGGPARQPARTAVGITLHGSELGEEEVLRGAEQAQRQWPDLEVVLIGTPGRPTALRHVDVPACDEPSCATAALTAEHRVMERLLASGELAAAVTLHYPFPIGVATVGRVVTPARGREMLIACTTGTAAADRVEAMVRSAVYGIAVARALGLSEPTVGVLNVEGAPQAERILEEMRQAGYPLRWAASRRADGGSLMRGNDVLTGEPDVLVTDSLTGNLLMKLLSAGATGGSYEATGYGYGPGVGPAQQQIVHIISRASGAPVIAGAIRYAGDMARGGLLQWKSAECAAAQAAGLDRLLAARHAAAGRAGAPPGGAAGTGGQGGAAPVSPPPAKVATAEIPGVEILQLEEAVTCLWAKGIYARSGMGCTGPVVLVADEDLDAARAALREAGFIG
ncbi:betaine reductase [Symbiobacterium terraclitae]|uniref:Betaine reductase n=1 Tax=Symbiobacterium terraclitae TaxID=557451 RepID=A0ABS4JV61_9FIRM|nr:glycine/sarcosine/betaine reductase complex component C subunit beta [Symbiobacterium terraclitae]MBP2019433.1 betaine reductase [Symbiobacterium terraclitae]